MKKFKLKKLQKLPPILFPVWLLFFLIEQSKKFILWLIGFWTCCACQRLFSPFKKPIPQIIENGVTVKKGIHYQKYRRKFICETCNIQKQAELERIRKKQGEYYYGG